MEIDVINALDDAREVCNRLSERINNNNFKVSVEDIFLKEISSFIKFISNKNGEQRVDKFQNDFLNGIKIDDVNGGDLSSLLSLLKYYDKNEEIKCILNCFKELSKYYILSKEDKDDIDKEKILEYITEITVVNNSPVQCESNYNVVEENQNDRNNLEVLLEDLNSLVGLGKVKEEVKNRIDQIKVNNRRKKANLKISTMSLHLVFTGNPGTGKTTVARKLSAIYKELGVLSKGHFVEVDRSKLVGGYVGSTAIKTQEVIDSAIGGILFIDEAYTLSNKKNDNDFGQEAIDTLLKAMEDNRDDLVVIVAGYTKEMETFINSNPGLQSRFNKYIEFEDYTADELYDIFKLLCEKDEFVIHDECVEELKEHFNRMSDNKPLNFANGRTVRNYYEKVIETMNKRLAENLDYYSDDEIQLIRNVDLIVE